MPIVTMIHPQAMSSKTPIVIFSNDALFVIQLRMNVVVTVVLNQEEALLESLLLLLKPLLFPLLLLLNATDCRLRPPNQDFDGVLARRRRKGGLG